MTKTEKDRGRHSFSASCPVYNAGDRGYLVTTIDLSSLLAIRCPGIGWTVILLSLFVLLGTGFHAARADFVEDLIADFAGSEILWKRSGTNVPFLPLGFIDLNQYQDTEVVRPNEDALEFDLSSVSQGAVLPMLMGPRDALFVGEYVSVSRFDARDSDVEDFDAVSLGVPVGWLRQVDVNWQALAFVMPMVHRADLGNSDWSAELLGGGFARQVYSERLWWIYGLYFDVGEGEDLYLPYVGASYEVNNEVTISAVLPWPAVLYSPDSDSLYRFGAAPSGASWALNSNEDKINYSLGNWNLGLLAEYRVHGNFWFGVEAGVSGLRSLRLEGGQWKGAEFDIDDTAFIRLALNFRPELP